MNACELAKELDACFTKADWEYVDDCVNMLRQQADRIANLEKQLNLHKNAHHRAVEIVQEKEDWLYKTGLDLRQQADRIAELEKQLENCAVTVDENSQDWKGMDGATAFWLIERHSNNWADAKKMMDEWHQANTTPQTKQCKDCGEINPAEIHTCSPQKKPLSDKEKLEIIRKWSESKGMREQDLIGLCDAIEERHGIK